MKTFRTTLFALLVLCLVPLTAQAQTITRLTLTGPAGEYITQGQTLVLTPADGTVMLYHGPLIQNGINFRLLSADMTQNWTVEFGGPDGTSPEVGLYTNAQRFPFAQPGHPRLNVYGNGRGCNELTGTFEVKYVTYNVDGAVLQLWVIFTQYCDNSTKPLTGELIFQMDASTPTRPTSWGKLKSIYR